MRWHDLLFLHWPVDEAALRERIPPGLEIETHGGAAWLGVVPFTMSGIRHRLLPPIPWHSAFPELNVRTYVRAERDGRPGVWFFSLDAPNRIAVRTARAVFGLAYMNARMSARRRDGWMEYRSRRAGAHTSLAYGPATTRAAEFEGRYRPVGGPLDAAAGSLESFLIDRYCLYAWRRGRLVRGEIHHAPWPLQRAEARISLNTMGGPLGIDLPGLERHSGPPLMHYAERLEVVAWSPEPA